jgi:hypothetical protein
LSARGSFLVVGAGRGGTSLLAALLDAHSALEVVFEHGAAEFLLDAPPGESLTRARSLRSACDRLAAQSTAGLWGNKITTEQVAALGSMLTGATEVVEHAVLADLFLGAFGDTKVVSIVRDGTSCIASKVQRTGQSMELAAARWMYSVRCVDFLRTHHSAQLSVRFEELVSEPEATMTTVCSFLGVEFEPAMLLATNSPKLLPEYRRTGFDTDAARPRSLPPDITALISPALTAAGYSVPR